MFLRDLLPAAPFTEGQVADLHAPANARFDAASVRRQLSVLSAAGVDMTEDDLSESELTRLLERLNVHYRRSTAGRAGAVLGVTEDAGVAARDAPPEHLEFLIIPVQGETGEWVVFAYDMKDNSLHVSNSDVDFDTVLLVVTLLEDYVANEVAQSVTIGDFVSLNVATAPNSRASCAALATVLFRCLHSGQLVTPLGNAYVTASDADSEVFSWRYSHRNYNEVLPLALRYTAHADLAAFGPLGQDALTQDEFQGQKKYVYNKHFALI
jgi:hypothetical protein